MPYRPRWSLRLLLPACAALALAGCREAPSPPDLGPGPETRLEAVPGQLQWYRGNLHAHSLWSDGDDFPEQVAERYRRLGYHFLALTEHDLVAEGERWLDIPAEAGDARLQRLLAASPPGRVELREAEGGRQVRLRTFDEVAAQIDSPGRFLLLPGEEISDFMGTASLHLTALPLSGTIAPAGGGDGVVAVIERNAAAVAAQARQSGRLPLVVLNHPNFVYSVTAEQAMRLSTIRHLELFNGHALANNPGDRLRPSTERFWDIVLTFRIAALDLPLMYGMASDDSHHYPDGDGAPGETGRGWIQVLAPALDARSLVAAMDQGHYYASTGVELARVVHRPGGMQVDVLAEPGVDYVVEFIGTRSDFDGRSSAAVSRSGQPIYASRRYSDDIGRVLARVEGHQASYRFDPRDLYVRARITSSRRHPNASEPLQFERAWVQPVPGPAANDPSQRRGREAPPSADDALHAAVTPRLQPLAKPQAALLLSESTPDCSLDHLANQSGRAPETWARSDRLRLGAWLADRGQPGAPDSVSVVLEGKVSYLAEIANGVPRPDVAAALGVPDFERAGFNTDLPLADLAAGDYALLLVGHYGDRALACRTRAILQLR